MSRLAEWIGEGGESYCANCKKLGNTCGMACPMIEHRPRTREGALAVKIGRQPGVWKLAPMTGTAIGLDFSEARARLVGSDHDEELLVNCFTAFEGGFLSGRMKSKEVVDAE